MLAGVNFNSDLAGLEIDALVLAKVCALLHDAKRALWAFSRRCSRRPAAHSWRPEEKCSVPVLGQQGLACDKRIAGSSFPWKHAGSARPNDLILLETVFSCIASSPSACSRQFARRKFRPRCIRNRRRADPRGEPRRERYARLHLSIAFIDGAASDVGLESDHNQFRHAERQFDTD